MFVCICNKVNENQVAEAVRQGADTLDKLESHLGVGKCCGKCKFRAHRVIQDNLPACEYIDATARAVGS